MPFIRVRGASIGDPLHEFDVSVREQSAHSELYEVLDPEPVAEARPAKPVPGLVTAPSVAPKKQASRRKKTSGGTSNTPAPAGATPEEKA